ncbi:hypothetical protein N0V88_005036 [Collariella sp. IMI 366227]|nr:hypothetical protein N0V88_005036 [Collariella sp. IMI 366227]
MVEVREVTLRLARSQRTWHGGITCRIVYDLVATELWSAKSEVKERAEPPQATVQTKKEQLDGITKLPKKCNGRNAGEVFARAWCFQKEADAIIWKGRRQGILGAL